MDKLSESVHPDEIPDGFTTSDPSRGPSVGEEQQSQVQQQQAQKRAVMEQALTSDALARLGTIKLVKPDKASAVESLIFSMAMSGKIGGRINEGKLIEMLEGIGAKEKKSTATINIQRKKYAFDSDDDDDDDDDLL